MKFRRWNMYHRGLRFLRKFASERGSISVLTMGLFLILLLMALILTDISSIYLAKRSLTLATETAVQRGMQNLDANQYYSGEYNATQMLKNSLSSGETDPGIPIDCSQGERDASEVFYTWTSRESSLTRENVRTMGMSNFQCDGFQIYIESRAIAQIPIPIPFINIREVGIGSHAGAVGERATTNNYYGFDIG